MKNSLFLKLFSQISLPDMTNFKKIGEFVIPVTLALMPALVFAQIPPVPVAGAGAITLIEIQNLIQRIAGFLIVVGIIIAVIFIIWGGITYMTAGGDATKAATARTRIFNGIIGAAVVLGVGVILQTIAGLVARTFFQ